MEGEWLAESRTRPAYPPPPTPPQGFLEEITKKQQILTIFRLNGSFLEPWSYTNVRDKQTAVGFWLKLKNLFLYLLHRLA
jgi:hypothetical protein